MTRPAQIELQQVVMLISAQSVRPMVWLRTSREAQQIHVLHGPSRAVSRVNGIVAASLQALFLFAAMLAAPSMAYAQSPENVAVVINDTSPDSVKVGEYYVRARAIPASNVIHIRTAVADQIDRTTYVRSIEQPIALAIMRERLQDRVLYIVLTKGVPLRIAGMAGRGGTMASVDSELALLYRRMTGETIAAEGSVDNPYFLGDRAITEARPFTHRDYDIFLVSRLDGYSAEDAIALVDRAMMPTRDGRFVLDQRDALVNRTGENWLDAASKRLATQVRPEQVVLETTPKPARDERDVLGYFSWGSTDPQNRVRSYGMAFAPGAIAANFVGTDARTFRRPPETWVPSGDATNRTAWYAGSPESLIGDLIADGVTGVAGYVAQPLLNGTVRPQILFPAYVAGMSLVEAFYLAIPHVSWQAVVVGDPLCVPFPRKGLSRSDIDAGSDSVTELPTFFSKRRVAFSMMQAPGIPERAVAMAVHGDEMSRRGDPRGARTELEEALRLAPKYTLALVQLAIFDDQLGDRDRAIERYRSALELQPNHVTVLNNLAYLTATYQKKPADAIPIIRRAVAQAPNNLAVLDTLAWIQHLLGDDMSASKVMAQVARANLANPDIRLHAAVIFAAVGARAVAQDELNAALKLNPALEKSEDVKAVRAQLAKLAK